MNALDEFERFLFAPGEADEMRSKFRLIIQKTTFIKDERIIQLLQTHRKVSGLYFLVLRDGAKEYKLYIGQTNSLANRLNNYVGEFQAHSPNDYKLRIFAAYLVELAPAAELDLYFAPTEVAKLKDAERNAIQKYKPLLNKLPPPSIEAREKLRSAFEFYYRSSFQQLLS